MYALLKYKPKQIPWNKGKLVGQKPPLKLRRYGRFGFACKSTNDIVT